MAAETVMLVSIFMILHPYLLYPLSLMAVARFRSKPVHRSPVLPKVSFIVTAFNEERGVREKIENTLRLDYPRELLEVIFVSDASTDATDGIIGAYARDGVRLIRMDARSGKNSCQGEALRASSGEIVVFSDVATRIDADGVSTIVSNFADPSIGCVSSVDRVVNAGGSSRGETLYVRYEMWLRSLESSVGSIVGASGSFFAIRRDLALASNQPTSVGDFGGALACVRSGLRAISDARCSGHYGTVADHAAEFGRKTRTVTRGLTEFFTNVDGAVLRKSALFSYELVSHKLARWTVPFFLIALFAASAASAGSSGAGAALFCLQVLFYAFGCAGMIAGSDRLPLFTVPRFFMLTNGAILVAWFRFLRGERISVWAPSERKRREPGRRST